MHENKWIMRLRHRLIFGTQSRRVCANELTRRLLDIQLEKHISILYMLAKFIDKPIDRSIDTNLCVGPLPRPFVVCVVSTAGSVFNLDLIVD